MTDEELGRAISKKAILYTNLFDGEQYERLGAAAILAAPSAHAAYGVDAQKAALACTGRTITEAFNGDFSGWVLPAWVPGKHLRAGQYLTEACQVKP